MRSATLAGLGAGLFLVSLVFAPPVVAGTGEPSAPSSASASSPITTRPAPGTAGVAPVEVTAPNARARSAGTGSIAPGAQTRLNLVSDRVGVTIPASGELRVVAQASGTSSSAVSYVLPVTVHKATGAYRGSIATPKRSAAVPGAVDFRGSITGLWADGTWRAAVDGTWYKVQQRSGGSGAPLPPRRRHPPSPVPSTPRSCSTAPASTASS